MSNGAIKQTKQGFWVLSDDPYISKWCEDLGRLDHDRTIDTLCAMIPIGGVAIDAGAAIGDHTVFYGHRVGPTGLVLAFEPQPDPFACLVMNTREQPWIHPYRMGLASQTKRLTIDFDRANVWATRIAGTSNNGFLAKSIDEITSEYRLDRLDFIKMDVEGYEPAVISGAYHAIAKYRPIIALEINRGQLAKFGWTPEDRIFEPLRKFGYDIRPIDPKHTLDLPQFDVICTPIK